MKSIHDGYNYIVRLDKGELLIASLLKFAADNNIKGAWVSGMGGACWAEVGFYHLEKNVYTWKRLEEALEITSLQGNLAWDGDVPFLHLHGNFSNSNMQTYGGHVKEAEVAGTCEIFLHIWDKDALRRRQDDAVGLKLLDI